MNRRIESSLIARAFAPHCATTLIFLVWAIIFLPSKIAATTKSAAKHPAQSATRAAIPEEIMLRIVRAEDERRWDDELAALMFDRRARVRHRAALAAGRIGDERALASLLSLLQTDKDLNVRAMAAFALGETELLGGADALVAALRTSKSMEVRARAIEALGKIAAAVPKKDDAQARALGETILGALDSSRGAKADRMFTLLGLTAVLRAQPANASPVVARFLSDTDARVRATAANALTRLRSKDAGDKLRELLQRDADAIVRANAARALGAAEDRAAFDALADRSLNDADERVRVSAMRSLGSLKDARAAVPLMQRVATLFPAYQAAKINGATHPRETNELLEIATTLGRTLANTGDEKALAFLRAFRDAEGMSAPEIEIAFARIAPAAYLRAEPFNKLSDEAVRAKLRKNWRAVSSIAQGLGEIAAMKSERAGSGIVTLQADALIALRALLEDSTSPALAVPDLLRALALFKSSDLNEVLRKHLAAPDVIVRATAAELLGELPPDEANAQSLAQALPAATRDEQNDAALAITSALGNQKTAAANETVKTALESPDHLVRRRAVAVLKANDAGDFSQKIGTVNTRNRLADYQRALARRGKLVRAIVTSDAGQFTIELLADDAPLTVDSFVQLARSGYFNGIAFHRVVPNFVIQGGDPRGDGNGGPPYQIRCEINEAQYDRGAVGMALSGKDTGGSQWFVTHSPQPHLDGGYTVFGRVTNGMEVVDRIVRGDVIRSIAVMESNSRAASKTRTRQHRDK